MVAPDDGGAVSFRKPREISQTLTTRLRKVVEARGFSEIAKMVPCDLHFMGECFWEVESLVVCLGWPSRGSKLVDAPAENATVLSMLHEARVRPKASRQLPPWD
jgi:hypothetical protein